MRVKASTFAVPPSCKTRKRTRLALALVACLAGSSAYAQSTTGGISGIVKQTGGSPAKVVIRNLDTGAVQERSTDADGRYSANTLAAGRYEVTAEIDGKPVGSSSVQVVPGSSSRVDLDSAAAADAGSAVTLDTVKAVANAVDRGGINPIDMTTPQLNTIVPVKLMDSLAGGRSAISTAQQFLSQVSVANSSGFPRFGGSSGAENRYYVNEFDVTNDRNGYGLTGIPAEAMATSQIIDDTASARYSNALGGSMAQTVKQGTNDFRFGYDLYYTPPLYSRLMEKSPAYRYPDGTYYSYPNGSREGLFDQFLWVSGPIVRDRLFFYVLDRNNPEYTRKSVNTTGTQQTVSTDKLNAPLVNLTWNITDNQQLNVMGERNRYSTYSTVYDLPTRYDTSQRNQRSWSNPQNLQRLLIGNYYWNINDTMTLSVMGGYMSTWALTPTSTSGTDAPYALQYTVDDRSSQSIGASASPNSLLPSTYFKRGYRAAFTWTPGDHQIMFGAENYDVGFNNLSISGENGNYAYHQYTKNTTLPNGVVIPANTPYVQAMYRKSGGAFTTTNRGAFIEDTWKLAPDFVVYAGVRYDQNIGYQLTGREFIDLKTVSPRVGVAWDVFGDGSTKFGAAAGQYTIPLPASINSGVGGITVNRTDYYAYTGINPDGSPILGGKYGDTVTLGSSNPADPRTIASGNIKNTRQNNYTVYLQHKFDSNWQGSVQAKYTFLDRTIETTCDLGPGSPLRNYLAAQGYPNAKISNACILYNPGSAIELTNDLSGTGQMQTITVPASVYGMPRAERTNYQLIGTLTHAESPDEPYFFNVSYTWGHMFGNYEGYFDESTGQSISGSSYAFDYPQLMQGATGDLSNDYRHSLKTMGFYRFRNGFRVGGNITAHTGAPVLCNSFYPNTENTPSGTAAASRGNYSYYCFNKLSPRGSMGRQSFNWTAGLLLAWGRKFGAHDIDVALNVSNVFNHIGEEGAVRNWNDGGYNTINPSYGFPGYQSPRSTSLVIRYTWN